MIDLAIIAALVAVAIITAQRLRIMRLEDEITEWHRIFSDLAAADAMITEAAERGKAHEAQDRT